MQEYENYIKDLDYMLLKNHQLYISDIERIMQESYNSILTDSNILDESGYKLLRQKSKYKLRNIDLIKQSIDKAIDVLFPYNNNIEYQVNTIKDALKNKDRALDIYADYYIEDIQFKTKELPDKQDIANYIEYNKSIEFPIDSDKQIKKYMIDNLELYLEEGICTVDKLISKYEIYKEKLKDFYNSYKKKYSTLLSYIRDIHKENNSKNELKRIFI